MHCGADRYVPTGEQHCCQLGALRLALPPIVHPLLDLIASGLSRQSRNLNDLFRLAQARARTAGLGLG